MLFYKTVVVHEHECALFYRNGRFDKQVGAGRYVLWGNHWRVVAFDIRRSSMMIPCQEILTRDPIPVRITLAVDFEVVDPLKATTEVEKYNEQLYLDVQVVLRESLAELSFDEFLDRKKALGELVRKAVRDLASEYGVDLHRVAIKDVTMPGNIRSMMLKTVEAEKSAQASLIKAREEVAAARARANAAKMMAENPAVLKLKELETLTELAKSPGSTIVYTSSTDALPLSPNV